MENIPAQNPIPPVQSPGMVQTQVNPAAAAFAAVGRKRGRHPKECACDKCTNRRAEGSQSPSAVTKRTLTETEKKLAKETCVAITHVMDTVALIVFRRNITILPETQQRAILSKVPMSEPLRQGIGESGALVAEKHGVAANMPEFALGAHLVAYVSAMAMLAWEMQQYTREYAKLKAEDTKNVSDGEKR